MSETQSAFIRKFIIEQDTLILPAMQQIDANAEGIVFVVDSSNMLIGSVTDGDIRRHLIRTGNLNACVREAMHKYTIALNIGEEENAQQMMRQKQVHVIPIIDNEKKIVKIITDDNSYGTANNQDKCLNGIPIIIMAGGKGTRLYPYTKILPKPLIPIGDVPILERVIDRLYELGAETFYVIINYRKEIIKAYFNEIEHSYKMVFIEENEALGTAGGISLIRDKFTTPVLITNCDMLIECDYPALIQHHISSRNGMTIVSSLKNTVIPYGVVHVKEQGIISSLEEKPKQSYFINTGMYVVNPEYLDLIPKNKLYHMTDFAEDMLRHNIQVGMFPISENSFLDMGQFEEMKKMEERIGIGK